MLQKLSKHTGLKQHSFCLFLQSYSFNIFPIRLQHYRNSLNPAMETLWSAWHDLWQMAPASHQHNHVTELHKSHLPCFLTSSGGFSSSVDNVMTAHSQIDTLRQSAQFEVRQRNFPLTLNKSRFLSGAKLKAIQTLELLYSLVPFCPVEVENNEALTPTSRNDKHVRDRTRLPLLW